ncbi:Diacylglycerol kinase, partial [Elasticomyces elasticus]
GENAFAFNGKLALPAPARDVLGVSARDATIGGPAALGVFSLWAGLVASASEAVDMFGWDDNLTIPMLCGIGIGGFLKAFGSW